MIVYRMARAKYIHDLSGYGAYLYGARWSLKGTYALYTAQHKSLAYLEYLVHQFERDTWPKDLFIASIEISKPEEITQIREEDLPESWNQLEYHIDCQLIAKRYFRQVALGVKVPSVIVPGEHNFIFNPLHVVFDTGIKILDIEKVEFDKRFLRLI